MRVGKKIFCALFNPTTKARFACLPTRSIQAEPENSKDNESRVDFLIISLTVATVQPISFDQWLQQRRRSSPAPPLQVYSALLDSILSSLHYLTGTISTPFLSVQLSQGIFYVGFHHICIHLGHANAGVAQLLLHQP